MDHLISSETNGDLPVNDVNQRESKLDKPVSSFVLFDVSFGPLPLLKNHSWCFAIDQLPEHYGAPLDGLERDVR